MIEDATESLGARYKGRPAGSSAGLACLSFNGNKITDHRAAAGCMATDDAVLARRARTSRPRQKTTPWNTFTGRSGTTTA